MITSQNAPKTADCRSWAAWILPVLTLILFTLSASAQTPVNLSSAFNINSGIVTDGTNFSGGGLDNDGNSYSSNLLGSIITANGMTFTLGPANGADAVSQATVSLPSTQASSLGILATGINGNQPSQTFTVTYSDNTTQTFTQSLSDWFTPQNFSGEAVAASTAHRDTSGGTQDARTFDLYAYQFSTNSAKTLKSIALPNTRNVVVLAISVVTSTSQVNLSGVFNREGIVTDGTTFSGGLDGDGNSYSSNLLGSSQTLNSVALTFGAANKNNAVSASGQTISLPSGQFANLLVVGAAVNGNQTGQNFTVTFSDGTSTIFTQSLSDWFTPQHFSGETTVAATAHRDTSSGGQDARTFNLYGYSFSLPSGKTTSSIKLPNNSNVEILAVALTGSGGGGNGIIGDCGLAPSGSGNGNVDYVMVYKSNLSIVCVDSTFWANSANSTAIPGFFPYFDAVVAQDKALFPVTTPNTQFVFEITVPTGGAGTGCGFSTLGNGGSFCDTVTGDAFTNVFSDPVSHAPIPGFFGFLLSLHESVNVFTGLASIGWPTDWWADHRSPFPNTMDLEFMQSIANNNSSLSSTVKQELLASATAQSERFIDPANPTGEHDNEVVLFNNIFNNQVFNNPNIVGFTGYANMVNLAINQDGLQWPSVSQDKNFTGDDNFSENLAEYVIAYLHLGFQSTTNQTAAFTSAGVGTLDTSIPPYSVNPANVQAIASAHCSIRAAANAGVNVSAQLAALQAGNFQNATATGGTQASCPSECTFTANKCVAKF
jgi:hypothetical protein